ncbi:MAG: HAMP domain-containing protein, partial [Blastocatellia bacterium]|nr:HAMP domain-containing protein [Blastocatellia bacterium]
MLTKLSFYFIHSLRAKVIGLSLLVSLIPLISVLILRALSLSYAEDVTTSAATTAIESVNKQALGYAQARAKALNERAEYIEKEAIRLSKKIRCIYEEPEKLPKKTFPNLQFNYDPKGYFWNSHLDGRMTALLPPMSREDMEIVHRFELLEVDFRRLIQKEAYIPNILINTKQHGLYTYPPVNLPAKIGAEILKLPIAFNLTPKFSNDCKTVNCDQPVWTKAYYDQLGDRGWTVTCFSPVYDKEGMLVAYVGIDLSIDNLVDQFISSQITAQSYTFVIDQAGYEMGLTAKAREDFAVPKRDTSYNLLQSGNSDCKQVVEKMLSGNDGLLGKFTISGKTKYVLLATVVKTGWKLAIVVPEADPLIPLIPIYQSLRTEEKKLEKISIYLLFFTFFSVLVATVFVANRFVTPIQNLSDATKKLGTNFQHIQIKVKGRDEVAELTKAFNEMGKQLESKIEAFAELYRIAITLSSATSLKEIDWNVVENVASLIKAKSCRLLLSDKLYMSINESPLIFSRSLINPNIYV